MKKIGLLSDTHGFIDQKIYSFFDECDEIWHAGDFGNLETADQFSKFKPLIAVYGNIDDHRVRAAYPKHQRFECEGIDVWMTHIGGYPGHYDKNVKPNIFQNPPKLFISGHSHILKVINDPKLGLLHINPGAAGNHGFHKVCTLLRFKIDGNDIRDMEIWEKPRNHSIISSKF